MRIKNNLKEYSQTNICAFCYIIISRIHILLPAIKIIIQLIHKLNDGRELI